jgi:pimeloyl-ACP methyl ester carboxylesterase
MHDIATVQQHKSGQRIRGGGYWGIPSEQSHDIGAWIDFAEAQGFPEIVVVGHSAGWAATRAYQVLKDDRRVVGLVMASGQVRPASGAADPDLMAQAAQLVRDGLSDDLLRLPNRSFPSFVSAATFLDDAQPAPASPDAAPVQCPVLAFFGTRGDVGTEAELELLRTALDHQERRPSDVRTVMIHNGDHMYTGEEAQVASVIADWISQIVLPRSVSSTGPSR